MDKKKSLLVISIAAILAFGVAIILKQDKKSETLEKEQEQVSIVKDEVQEESDVNKTAEVVEDTEVTEVIEVKKALDKSVKQVSAKPTVKSNEPKIEHPVKKSVQVEPLEGSVSEEKVDPGIMKENGTNNIIITREFKSKSRNKYVFEGFGIQVAPTK